MPTRRKSAPKPYAPSQALLEKYADVMVNFALNDGKGLRKGEVVEIYIEDSAKPLYAALRNAVWKAGGHVIGMYSPSNTPEYNFSRDFYKNASPEQIQFVPKRFMRGLVDDVDHSLIVIGETNPHALQDVDPKLILMQGKAIKFVSNWYDEKENAGKYSWTICLYGTEQMAQEAGLSLREYWQQIAKACFLDAKDPVAEWKKVDAEVQAYAKKLTNLKIEWVHAKGPDMDIKLKIGANRKWIGGGGKNIPSFEIFTSPDWRGTEGWIRFNQPLYRYGNLITGIELEFKGSRVIKSKAAKNEKLLKEMIATEGADKIGEYSLTDRRFSRITKFMAETLYDENIGGRYGNTHVALGQSFAVCLDADITKIKKAELAKLGFNESSVHTDIISTAPRTVTATLQSGKEKVIYDDGQFTL